ncbi:MAG: hypothetical protein IT176_13675 [Acidobacteria bacterium]|nr:hypothetical protein [Acidobacteriota bacterium]
MHSRTLAGALAALCLLAGARGASAADDSPLFRVFMKDGTALASYGEFAIVGDRVVFSMPVAATSNPPLHLVDVPADRVDWDRTNRYTESARADHYIATRAESDYLALSGEIVRTLDEVAATADTGRRLEIVERARERLAAWPAGHYNYRSAEVLQLLQLLDEAIAGLRAASGGRQFALNFSAFVQLPPAREPLLPPPTAQESIQQILDAAQLSDSPEARKSLLSTAIAAVDRDGEAIPAVWARDQRASAQAQLEAEIRIDRSYRALTQTTMGLARERAKAADVRGIEALLRRIRSRDGALGRRRPDVVLALIRSVESSLDAARRLRLERDRWAMRAPALRRYRQEMAEPFDLFARLKPGLEDIRALSGSTSSTLGMIERVVGQLVDRAGAIEPPAELAVAHALLVSAARLADNAGRIRREATLAGDIARAWDASSAAAGALLLGARARAEMQAVFRIPQLR